MHTIVHLTQSTRKRLGTVESNCKCESIDVWRTVCLCMGDTSKILSMHPPAMAPLTDALPLQNLTRRKSWIDQLGGRVDARRGKGG